MTTQVTNPAPMPLVILNVSGIRSIVATTGKLSSTSEKLIPRILSTFDDTASLPSTLTISTPTTINAGAVADAGMAFTSATKGNASRNRTPVVTETSPDLPPTPTPADDSMYTVADEELATPPAVSYTHLRAHETVLDLVCR